MYLNENNFEDKDDENGKGEIWCLELNSKQWFKSHTTLPLEMERFYRTVKTDDNYVHFINGGWGRYHIRMSLRDMIPNEMYRFYTDFNMKLMDGFIAICLNEEWKNKIPNELKRIIIAYHCDLLSEFEFV